MDDEEWQSFERFLIQNPEHMRSWMAFQRSLRPKTSRLYTFALVVDAGERWAVPVIAVDSVDAFERAVDLMSLRGESMERFVCTTVDHGPIDSIRSDLAALERLRQLHADGYRLLGYAAVRGAVEAFGDLTHQFQSSQGS